MRRSIRFVCAVLFLRTPLAALGAPGPNPAEPPVVATIETTLSTDAAQIRQYAFDGDANTFFASQQNVGNTDHFTLVFDKPEAVKSIGVVTGRRNDSDKLDAGTLEVSADGKTFVELVEFAGGVARAEADGQKIQAFRVKPGADLKYALAIREFTVESDRRSLIAALRQKRVRRVGGDPRGTNQEAPTAGLGRVSIMRAARGRERAVADEL